MDRARSSVYEVARRQSCQRLFSPAQTRQIRRRLHGIGNIQSGLL